MQRSKKLPGIVVWLSLVISLFTLAGVAAAQTSGAPAAQDGTPPAPQRPVTPDDVNAIARQMYCPICENEPLDVCRTAACQQWRAQIAQMLSEGQTDAQIKQYFVDRYGLRVLGAPPAEGISLWLWVLPLVAIVFGAIYVALLMKRMRARGAAASTGAALPTRSPGDDYTDRVERDLKNY